MVLTIDPGSLVCPDHTSDEFTTLRTALVNPTRTNDEAVQLLNTIWAAKNDAEKVAWQQQLTADEATKAEAERLVKEAETAVTEAQRLEDEAIEKEERKKNKAKYLPILDRPPPEGPATDTSPAVMRKLQKGEYVHLWHFTNKGLDSVQRDPGTSEFDAVSMVRDENGSLSLVPSVSTNASCAVIDNARLLWDDFLVAIPRLVMAMEDASWPAERVEMFAKFWGALQTHRFRNSRDPLEKPTLQLYESEQRKRWHAAVTSASGGWNISIISERLLQDTKETLYWEQRRNQKDPRNALYVHRNPSLVSFTDITLFSLCSSLHLHIYVCRCRYPCRCSLLLLMPLLIAVAHCRCSCCCSCCSPMLVAVAHCPLPLLIPAAMHPAQLSTQLPPRNVGVTHRDRDSGRRCKNPQTQRRSASPARQGFSSGAEQIRHPPCAVCLGRHQHTIITCTAKSTWNSAHQTCATRINRDLCLRKGGRAICFDWQRRNGCLGKSTSHALHICSGCTATTHGAFTCSRAEKA